MQERPDRLATDQVLTASCCTSCGRPVLPARELCPDCWGPTEPLPLSGSGQVETCTVIHRAPAGFESPYAVAYVALQEGVRAFGPVRDIDPEAVRPGLQVRVVPGGEGEPPYWFSPAGAS